MPFQPYNPTTKTFSAPTPGFRAYDPITQSFAPAPAAPQTTQSLLSQAGSAFMGGIKKIGSSISQGSSNIQQGVQQASDKSLPMGTAAEGLGKVALGAAQAGFGIVAGASQSALSPVTPIVSSAINNISPSIASMIDSAKKSHPEAAAKIDSIAQKASQLAAAHPQSTSLISDMVNDALTAIGGGAAEDFAPVAADAVKGTISKASDALAQSSEEKAANSAAKELKTIQDSISPKPTAKEAKTATVQGRLIKGKKPGLFTAGKTDDLMPSKETERAASTIQEQIPGAAKMDATTLYGKVMENVTNIAKKLKPEMEKVPVTNEMVDSIGKDIADLHAKQMEDAKATDEPNVAKWQKNFLAIVGKIGKGAGDRPGNLNDLWEAAKDYDASIKENVKKANDQSPEDLQTQKEIWQQNRGILKKAINDSVSGLGEESKQAFSDMTDMYNASEGILSKAKIETKAIPSKLAQFAETPKGKIIKGSLEIAGGGWVADKVLKGTTGIGF